MRRLYVASERALKDPEGDLEEIKFWWIKEAERTFITAGMRGKKRILLK